LLLDDLDDLVVDQFEARAVCWPQILPSKIGHTHCLKSRMLGVQGSAVNIQAYLNTKRLLFQRILNGTNKRNNR